MTRINEARYYISAVYGSFLLDFKTFEELLEDLNENREHYRLRFLDSLKKDEKITKDHFVFEEDTDFWILGSRDNGAVIVKF